ncbi:MAG: high-affinity branched-chain amino acid ABC transporter permease LivM [Alphaproteobacteria bacterium]|nr:high-affinity branched-chain amino acid ABC transporter permease LivM [Alphaproteobacteria bacterium]
MTEAAVPTRIASAMKEAGLAAFVALVLAMPMVGLYTVDEGGVLVVRTRFDWVLIGVLVVFAGRLAMAYWPATLRIPARRDAAHVAADGHFNILKFLGIAAISLAVLLPVLPVTDRYVIDVATTVLIYVMLGWGLNIVVGLAGLLDLGYVAFYAVGAYSFALLARNFGLNFWECLPLAGALAALCGILLGFPVLRLRGDYLAIVTLGFGEMIRIVLINWQSFTGGPNGLTSIPRPSFFGLPFTRNPEEGETAFHQFFGLEFAPYHRLAFLYYLILALALVTNAFTMRIRRLPIGRAWEALREDEIACRALGINPTNTKLTAFAIGAMFGGFAGSFFAARQGFISPESFTFIESAMILAVVVLGGMGSQIGVVLAATLLVVLPELGREFAEFRMVLFGAAMIAIMIWRPHGLLARRDPSIVLPPARRGAA